MALIETDLPTVPNSTCPFCGGAPTMTCRCKRGDMKCANGHEWHYDKDLIHGGSSDHGSTVCCNGPAIARAGVPDNLIALKIASRFQKG